MSIVIYFSISLFPIGTCRRPFVVLFNWFFLLKRLFFFAFGHAKCRKRKLPNYLFIYCCAKSKLFLANRTSQSWHNGTGKRMCRTKSVLELAFNNSHSWTMTDCYGDELHNETHCPLVIIYYRLLVHVGWCLDARLVTIVIEANQEQLK